MSGNHLPLEQELQVNRHITSPVQLMEISADGWKEILTKTDVPPFIQGNSQEEKIRLYTDHIQTILNAAYPTQRIGMMLRNKELLKLPNTFKPE